MEKDKKYWEATSQIYLLPYPNSKTVAFFTVLLFIPLIPFD